MRRKAPTTVSVKPENQPYLSKWLSGHDQSASANWGSGFKVDFYNTHKKENIIFILNSLLQKEISGSFFFSSFKIFSWNPFLPKDINLLTPHGL